MFLYLEIQLIGHEFERHKPVYIRSQRWQLISEQKPSHEVEGTACRAQTGLCWDRDLGKATKNQLHVTSRRTTITATHCGRGAKQKFLLSERQIKAVWSFQWKHLKDTETMTNKILWFDETKIELFGLSCLEETSHHSSPAQYHPNGKAWWWQHNAVGVWSGLSESWMEQSTEISLMKRMGRRFTSQQNNDPKHAMQERLRDNSVNVLELPSRSPDLNPIAHPWRDLEIAVH